MIVMDLLKRLYTKITLRNGIEYKHTADEDLAFLNRFSEPTSNIERSYYQFLCQKWNDKSPFKYLFADLISLFLIPIYKRLFINNARKQHKERPKDVAFTMDFFKSGILPDINVSHNETYIFQEDCTMLNENDLEFLKARRLYKYGAYFYFKNMCRLASYSYAINIINVKKIYSSCEYSFTSSLLTEYCEINNVSHVNLMHGDKLFDLTDSFSHFHEFYVWDEEYIRIFSKLRCNTTKYIIHYPFKIDLPVERRKGIKYYLQSETVGQLKKIYTLLESSGFDYKVRKHPLYSTKIVNDIFPENSIEEAVSCSLQESLGEMEYIVSVFSTVLFQAYKAGKKIVVDDISNPRLYYQLVKRDYIISKKDYILLSSLIN